MVFVRKTYTETRSIAVRIGAFFLVVLGFLVLILMPATKMPKSLGGGTGIAHADAPNCSSCDAYSCSEADADCGGCDCGEGGGGSGEGGGAP